MRRFVLLVPVLSAFALGCGKEPTAGGPPGSPNGPPTSGPASDDLAAATPDVTMTAEAWSKEYGANRAAANAKYAGRVIELTGTVKAVNMVGSKPAPPRLELTRAPGENCFDVSCLLSDPAVWEKVWSGATVTVRGRLRTRPNWPGELEPAVVVKGPTQAMPSITAEALAAEVIAANDPAYRKEPEYWYVEGEVLKTEVSEKSQGSRITLKGKGVCNPICVVDYWERNRINDLKPGDRVKALGSFNGPRPGDATLSPLLLLVTFKKL